MNMPLQWGAICAACLFALPGFALDAVPAQVLFNTLNSSAQVQINDAGAPLGASDIRSWRLMVDDSNYAHMIKVTPVDGGIQVQPSASLQVGTYDLEVTTSRGVIVIPVNAPLSGEVGLLEERTAEKGREAAMKELGLSQTLPRDAAIQITLPEQYVVGQEVRVHAPSAAGVAYRWSVNGVLVQENSDALSYILPAEGEYLVQLEQSADTRPWRVVSQARTMAQEKAPQQVTLNRNQRITLRAPAGYGAYTWKRNGAIIGLESSVVTSYPEPGVYTVTCRCEKPEAGPVGGFFNVHYQLTVQ